MVSQAWKTTRIEESENGANLGVLRFKQSTVPTQIINDKLNLRHYLV